MRYRSPRPHPGVTLVEMLVAVALLVLMMTVIVTIFGAATGAVSGLQSYQQLDGDLRELDMTIRQDLIGITARMTPPLDPAKNLGYFEYGENAFADLQGEDTDDYIRFTAKAPEGQLFTGRMWLGAKFNSPNQPVLVSSQFAEIIYFLRNGNLYRRVLLILPERQTAVDTAWTNAGGVGGAPATRVIPFFQPSVLGGLSVSWQGVNDLSARPLMSGPAPTTGVVPGPIVLNTLGDLTNRENRFAYPRFANDFAGASGGGAGPPDGIADDFNQDGSGAVVGDSVPDYYPTLYPGLPSGLLFEVGTVSRVASTETMAFPYVFPGAYSQPDPDTMTSPTAGAGWIHSLDPSPSPAFSSYLDKLRRINHAPLASGDSLPNPNPNAPAAPPVPSGQTWWGFPIWRETLLPGWTDPNIQVTWGTQPDGLHPYNAAATPTAGANTSISNLLPPMTAAFRANPQPFNDATGRGVMVTSTPSSSSLWASSWEDDLLMTGVRSFDVKAYDDSFPGYVDLGWGDDLRLLPASNPASAPADYLSQGNGAFFLNATPDTFMFDSTGLIAPARLPRWLTVNQTFAHEGRMPPLVKDNRLDAQYPNPFYPRASYPAISTTYNGNIGDNSASIMRLRRVWDTWSTDYTRAPATGIDPTTKLPVGPPSSPPIYPSYPPPYPAPLRGIQIQIRVVDPRGERVKVLTIRQDFSDKL